jgi:DNA repair protein RadC
MEAEKPIYIPLNQRSSDEQPRERLSKYGPQRLRTSELIALILRTGSSGKSAVDLADRMLQAYNDDLSRISELSLSEIKSNKGFGPAAGCALAAAFELGRRVHTLKNVEKPLDLKKVSDVANLFRKEYGTASPEKFVAFYINRRHRLIDQKLISQGSGSKTVVDPRDIFKEALLNNASAVILAHNHPSGALQPSPHDLSLTRELVEMGHLFRIPVVEHVIVAEKSENGTLQNI